MTPRLYIEDVLAAGETTPLSPEETHYLKNVLRREVGSDVLVFNERNGEFQGSIVELGKRGGSILLQAQCRRADSGPVSQVTLAFAPVKRQPTETIIQKGTELGLTRFVPVLTARTNSDRLRVDRLSAIAKEAAEQSGRLSIPQVEFAISLPKFIDQNEYVTLIFCDEAGGDPEADWGGATGRAQPMQDAIANVETDHVVILIGPEGGFTPEERATLRARYKTIPVTLGPRILRADTAAIAAITLWQAAKGDLRKS